MFTFFLELWVHFWQRRRENGHLFYSAALWTAACCSRRLPNVNPEAYNEKVIHITSRSNFHKWSRQWTTFAQKRPCFHGHELLFCLVRSKTRASKPAHRYVGIFAHFYCPGLHGRNGGYIGWVAECTHQTMDPGGWHLERESCIQQPAGLHRWIHRSTLINPITCEAWRRGNPEISLIYSRSTPDVFAVFLDMRKQRHRYVCRRVHRSSVFDPKGRLGG